MSPCQKDRDNAKWEKTINFNQLAVPSSPNYYLVCPKGYCQNQQQQYTPVFQMNIIQLERLWQKVLQQTPRIKTIHNDPQNHEYSYIQHSRWWHFPDLIYVKFVCTGENQSSMIIYSRSKYGYSDFGVNKRRVLRWINQMTSTLALN